METLEGVSPPVVPAYVVVRRSRLIATVIVLALVVGMVLVLDRAVFSYQPLSFDAGGAHGAFGTAHGSISAPEYRGAEVFRFEPGGTMQFGATLSNVGSRSVRVTGFPRFRHAYMRPAGVELQSASSVGGMVGPWATFEPFTLEGGETRQVRFTWRFPDCDLEFAEGSWSALSLQEVRYEVLGVGRSVTLQLPAVLALEGAMGSCPS